MLITSLFSGLYNSETVSPVRGSIHHVILYKDAIYDDYGFSVSDGLYERGVYINRIRKGGPADIVGLLRPYDRILQVCVWFVIHWRRIELWPGNVKWNGSRERSEWSILLRDAFYAVWVYNLGSSKKDEYTANLFACFLNHYFSSVRNYCFFLYLWLAFRLEYTR